MAREFTVITLFPSLVEAYADIGLARKGRAAGLLEIHGLNPRDFAPDARRTVDDLPYGGGPGMVLQVAPLRAAIRAARARRPDSHVVYLSPQGRQLTQEALPDLLGFEHLVLLAGRYEGVDERILERDVDAEWSIGDYVLSGGELPALVIIDALIRLIPGVMGDAESAIAESFTTGLLDYPHYTRPEVIDGQAVPPVLLSGHHAEIAAWRLRESVRRTARRRPDLLARVRGRKDVARALAEIDDDDSEKPAGQV
ncbi:MAG: tRNA (guanosine(37)-N1)-methyltransferase TrmD [Gammaproteobacteria bacterium]